jgi:hypothetical protein
MGGLTGRPSGRFELLFSYLDLAWMTFDKIGGITAKMFEAIGGSRLTIMMTPCRRPVARLRFWKDDE